MDFTNPRRAARSVALVLLLPISAASLAQSAPAASAYSVVDAKLSSNSYDYLTVETVTQDLNPKVAMSLPDPSTSRLIILKVTFKAKGDPNDMKELIHSDLEAQWSVGGVAGKSPMIGVHFSKDWIVTGTGGGAYFSMKPSTYEVFTIVPKAAKQINLAMRQPDGSSAIVKTKILIPAGR